MAFRNPIVAGVQLVRAAIQSSNFSTGVSGWQITEAGSAEFNNIMIRGADVVDATQLFYNGTPATGNLVVSVSPTSGTDAYGNVYQSGIVAYDTGGDYIQQADGTVVGWNFSLSGLSATGQFNVFGTGSGTAEQGAISLWPATSSSGGPPILDMYSTSADGTQVGYIGLFNSDTVRLNPNSAAQSVLEYTNGAATAITGYGVVSDQGSNFHVHAAAYTPTFTSGSATFAHGCSFTPTGAILMACGSGAPTVSQLSYSSPIGATNITAQAYGHTGTGYTGTPTIFGIFVG